MTQNSLSSQLEHVNRQHENAIRLGNAFLKALTSQQSNVSVELEAADGTISTILIPSNIFLSNELTRVKDSLRTLTGLSDSQSALVSNDGAYREVFLSNNRKSYQPLAANEIVTNFDIKLSTNSIIEQLLSPLTEVEYTLPDEYKLSKRAKITKLTIDDGDISLLTEGMSYNETLQFLQQNNYTYVNKTYDVQTASYVSRYFGDFETLSASIDTSNRLVIVVDKLTYSDDLNVVFDSKELEIGDYLTSKDGSLKLQIHAINTQTNTITCNFISGVGSVNIGPNELSILSEDNNKTNVRIPVKLNEKSIIFISPIDSFTNFASAKSTSKIFDSDEYIVNVDGTTYGFNEYFSSKVVDMGNYFESIIRESMIPASLGEKPSKPELNATDFQVLQVNTHLTNTPTAKKLQKLQQEKDVLNSQISALNTSIATLSTKIAMGNYSTDAKRDSDIALRQNKINDKLQKTSLLSSIVNDISTALANNAEKSISPKYRVRGFWPVQTDIPSSITDPQKIVQYQARYRYVSNTGNTANSPQVTYKDGENDISATFSAWNIVKTEPLERTIDEDGSITWIANSPVNSDQLNINQLDIPIQYGESVELQIRSISEAGWPNSPIMSDWSTLTRVDFPESLLQESDLAAIQRKNNQDVLNVKIQQEFSSQGVTQHIAEVIYEQDKYYAHDARKIASGEVSAEQKIISQFELNQLLKQQIQELNEIVNKRYASIAVQILDESLQTYDVNHFSTVKLFAGYYSDDVDLTESSNYGSIVTKIFYIRLINRNAQTVEMLSISPGSRVQNSGSSLYNNVPILLSGSNEVWPQKNAQIFYNRNVDINSSIDLYADDADDSINTVTTNDIDNSAIESQKNVVHLNSNIIEVVKLVNSASLENYAVLHKSHPAYLSYVASSDDSQILEEFSRIQKFNEYLRTNNIQNALVDDMILRFEDHDKYLIGKNTVGSALYASLNNIDAYQVEGIDTGSAKEIYSGEQDSILIPIVFQYRMTDALGNPNGSSELNQNSNFEYTKTLGVDMLINNKKFAFDIQISAKFRSSSISTNKLGVRSTSSISTNTNINID